jgi:hypothetical protein
MEKDVAATPSPQPSLRRVCGQCATVSGPFVASGAKRRQTPSFSRSIRQKARAPQ